MKCVICGKEFIQYRGHGICCSDECRKIHKDNNRTFTMVKCNCFVCGKEIERKQSDYNRSTKNGHVFYCSDKCERIHRKKKYYCAYCGSEILRNDCSVKKTVYCNKKCAELHGEYRPRQETHWHWRGGGRYYRGKNWTVIRQQIRKRDNYTCQKCGITEEQSGHKMDVHHIRPYRLFDNDEMANDFANLISLCRSCHHREDALLRV